MLIVAQQIMNVIPKAYQSNWNVSQCDATAWIPPDQLPYKSSAN